LQLNENWPTERTVNCFKSALHWLDRYLGRGSYVWIEKLLRSPREYTQITYGDLIAKALKPGDKWLDAGSGHQILEIQSSALEETAVRKAAFGVGCDLDCAALRKHRSLSNRICCGLEKLPFHGSSFDLITLNNVAEHLEEPTGVLTEFARVLNPTGKLIIHTPNIESYEMGFMRLLEPILPRRLVLRIIRFLDYREADDVFPTYYRANTREHLLDLCRSAGLVEESLVYLPARPLFFFIAPLCFIELLVDRFLLWLGYVELVAGVIVGIYSPSPHTRPARRSEAESTTSSGFRNETVSECRAGAERARGTPN
jgi:ubiquinone/menaquinone biosynthesis C-methylase UbiE